MVSNTLETVVYIFRLYRETRYIILKKEKSRLTELQSIG